MDTQEEKKEIRRRWIGTPHFLSLMVSFVSQITIIAGSVRYILLRAGQRVVNNVADQSPNRICPHTKERPSAYFEPPYKIKNIKTFVILSRLFGLNDTGASGQYAWSQFQVID